MKSAYSPWCQDCKDSDGEALGQTRLEWAHKKVQMAQKATRHDASLIEVLMKIIAKNV